jgi:hypothetical protein
MVSLIGGFVAFILGVIWLVIAWDSFLIVLAGTIPIILIIGGIIAIYGGGTALKDKLEVEKEEEIEKRVAEKAKKTEKKGKKSK